MDLDGVVALECQMANASAFGACSTGFFRLCGVAAHGGKNASDLCHCIRCCWASNSCFGVLSCSHPGTLLFGVWIQSNRVRLQCKKKPRQKKNMRKQALIVQNEELTYPDAMSP